MRRLFPVALLSALPAVGLAAEPAKAPMRRLALVVGANHGAPDRVRLRYAVADAERFSEVVTRMGGVQAEDRIVLRDPTRQALLDALAETALRVGGARVEAERVEVIVYFSGHADDKGLMLGREMLAYRELRASIHGLGADVGITILDACASGAITRLKGGVAHPAFLTDTSSEVQGYAFLTSSSENEAAQESERLRGSFFTHALLTGLRGAADVSDDGKVTLSEAYQFAFHETLAETAATQAGAQHPAYDIKMAGTGDVVMTEVRQNSSSLVLSEAYDGRFLVLNSRRQLVAELHKPAGRKVELGLEPGEYDVFFEQAKQLLTTSVHLAEGQRQELVRETLKPTERRPSQSRGPEPGGAAKPDLLDGRIRVQVAWLGRFAVAHWLRPDVALQLSVQNNTFGGAERTFLLGGRYYPHLSGRLRPFVGASVGSVAVPQSRSSWTPEGGFQYEYLGTRNSLGSALEAGADIYIGRNFSVSLSGQGGYAGGWTNFNTWLSLGWTFGGPKKKD